MVNVTWADVLDRRDEPVEFGASHVRCAWRKHSSSAVKFESLESAFVTSKHAVPKLLQDVGGNPNASNFRERGEAIFAAVWYRDSDWAILCDATRATLVPRNAVAALKPCKRRNDELMQSIRDLFESSPTELRRVLDDSFFSKNVRRVSTLQSLA